MTQTSLTGDTDRTCPPGEGRSAIENSTNCQSRRRNPAINRDEGQKYPRNLKGRINDHQTKTGEDRVYTIKKIYK